MKKNKIYPIALSFAIILADQISKTIIAKNIPLNTIGKSFFNGIFRIIHVRNLGIAFSMGTSAPEILRIFLFIILPLVVLSLFAVYYFKTNELSRIQRWACALILGGGFGNLIDRIFRPLGVVDFLDFKFYGIFGLDRWPTFNVADSSVVAGATLLVISYLFLDKKTNKN